MTTTHQAECSATTVRLYVAFELGSTKWTLGFATSPAHRPRLRTIRAGDVGAVALEIARAKARFEVPGDTAVWSCYEAGRDGFWLHRWLAQQGVSNVVVDSASIEVNRRHRRAKTDRLDVGHLLSLLQRWAGGERKAWSVVEVPGVEAEDERQLTREITTVETDRIRLRNRIQGLLAQQGVRLPVDATLETRLATARTADGRPFPAGLRARVLHEWAALVAVEARAAALAADRRARLDARATRVAEIGDALRQLRGIGDTSAALFSAELFGTRHFTNPRQVGALTGLAPVPYRSDQIVRDQGIAKTGRGEIRRVAIQIAWGWLRWQPTSTLTQWFHRRFAKAGSRARRIGIVAVARKLLIALWRFSVQGVVVEGAVLKSTT
jgi:transposase